MTLNSPPFTTRSSGVPGPPDRRALSCSAGSPAWSTDTTRRTTEETLTEPNERGRKVYKGGLKGCDKRGVPCTERGNRLEEGAVMKRRKERKNEGDRKRSGIWD